jgi:hypothetical protein
MFARALLLIVGLVMMVVGLALGVSLVLLPFGVPLGLAGLGVFLWGLYLPQRNKAPGREGPP